MKKTICILAILFILMLNKIYGQNSNEHWDSYIATFEDGLPGSVTLRMDLIKNVPKENLPFVLVTGITYKTSRDDGFPENETFKVLHKIGDDLIELIGKEAEFIHVGSFMYNKERLEYFYINEGNGLKEKLEKYYADNYPDNKFYLNIKEDNQWRYYKEFLYPNEETLNFMADQSIIKNLLEAGDQLKTQRRVDHWLYFPTESDMEKCKEAIKQLKYSIDSFGKINDTSMAFELKISRIDKVDIDSIYPITSELRKLAKDHNGKYDGWETTVEKTKQL